VSTAGEPPRRRAVFLDRDGTIIEDVGYLWNPDDARLLPGSADAIRRLNEQGFLVIVATNQSGIARGILSRHEYQQTERRIDALLQDEGAHLDAHYFCPHLPELTGPCDCRKPGVLLYRQAAEQFDIDLPASWWVGDRIRDVLPAETFGASGILVHSRSEVEDENSSRFAHAPNLLGAVDLILNQHS
jgi:D-glycero-D-manno-heptose 1,7-bisphosphate phosphatase